MSTSELGLLRSELDGLRSDSLAAWQAAELAASQARERHNAVDFISAAALDLPDGGSDEIPVRIERLKAALLLIATLSA